jgi:hypothetical protein
MNFSITSDLKILRATTLAVSLGFAGSPSLAQSSDLTTVIDNLDNARECVLRSEPDFERAISCYQDHMLTMLDCFEASDAKTCLESLVVQLRQLQPVFNTHERAQEIALLYDASRCHGVRADENGLPKDVLFLQCQFIALSTQVTAGHVASIWGELHFKD